MADALQTQVLLAVGAGYHSLESIAGSLQAPEGEVDERIRALINQRLLTPHQRDNGAWYFRLTPSGERLVTIRNRIAAVPGVGSLLGEGNGPTPKTPAVGSPAAASRVIARASRRPMTTSETMLTPAEEAARAELRSWLFAAGAVGLVAFLVVLVWLATL